MASWFLVRSRYTEDCLAEGVARGLQQYLILGAGLDTFAYRQPPWAHAIRIFEVDYPATQGLKREQLARSNIALPSNLAFVPIDFETTSLNDALRSTGFAFDKLKLDYPWSSPAQVTSALSIEELQPVNRHIARKRGS